MFRDRSLTGLTPGTFLLAALSLSIGWGIRGNFGHEYGAMIPGALTAIAVCVMSGRKDWRDRVMYFAMFGALGWGFGEVWPHMMAHCEHGMAPAAERQPAKRAALEVCSAIVPAQ